MHRWDRHYDLLLAHLARLGICASANGAAKLARVWALATGRLRQLEFATPEPYGPHARQRLQRTWATCRFGPQPAVLYFHGGGFQMLSHASHWWFAAQFARAGFVVLNVDYRLAPQFSHPAAADDARLAYLYACDGAERLGIDPTRLVVAGDSAGANLALSLMLDARLSPRPRAAVLLSGLLQVSLPSRLFRGRNTPRIVRARIESITRDYARAPLDLLPEPAELTLDPLRWLEQHPEAIPRLTGTIYASCGTHDPVLDDALRLRALLAPYGPRHRVSLYPGEPHVFQGMPWREQCEEAWLDCLRHLRAQV